MTRDRAIFLGFAGPPIAQPTAMLEIGHGIQCWDLQQFTRDQFIDALKAKIPPVNSNVLRHYKKEDGVDQFGVSAALLQTSAWGLLIPDPPGEGGYMSYAETLFLLNLYSPVFLRPLFYGSDFGIYLIHQDQRLQAISHHQNQSTLFKRSEFVTFFETLRPQGQYGSWYAPRTMQWDKEDWRLFAAALLYTGLQEYETSKSVFGWQRESADMAAVLESLFTAGDTKNEEVGYRLRKRLAVLLSSRFPGVESNVKKLYAQRSDFVHGAFFEQIAKDSKRAQNNLPVPDFGFVDAQRDYVRWALVGYLHLAHLLRKDPAAFKEKPRVIEVLEESIIDVEFRACVLDAVGPIFHLLPPPTRYAGLAL